MRACGVNPADWKIRDGFGKEFFHHSFPLIPGWDFSGVVDAVDKGVQALKNKNQALLDAASAQAEKFAAQISALMQAWQSSVTGETPTA